LLWFAFVLQVAVIVELCLNRIIGIVLNTKRRSTRMMADANFVSSIINLIVSVALLPITWAGVCVQFIVGQFFFLLGLLVIVGVFAVLNQSSANLLTLLVNVYNSGVGEAMNTVVIAFLELFAPLFRILIPVWNSTVNFWTVLLRNVFLPFVFVNTSSIPDLLLNLTTMFSTLAVSLAGYVTSLLECVQYSPAPDNSTSPFWVNDMTCVATPYTLSLDLMTPSIFAQRTVTNVKNMFITSCGPATNVLTILFYPLIDYNFYKMIHGAVNFVLHVCFTLPVWTANRCAYAEETTNHQYTSLEKKIMCIPDVSHAFSILTGTFKAFGAFVDNFLDIGFAVVYSAVTGERPDECSDISLQAVWQDASDVFGTRKLHAIGMTRSLYAITDGDSVMYHSMSGSNKRSSFALHTWPFQINTEYGVAAVRYGESTDYDDEGGDRTGLLGCQCRDTVDGIVVVCASVPYQKHLAEDDADNSAFTTHKVRFLPDTARAGLTCSTIVIRVSSLRFSRKRFSSPSPGGTADASERSFIDPYRLTEASGDKSASSRTADAAVIIMPLCKVRDSVTCLPTLANCFPFCMALHSAGQSTQTLSMHNAQSFTEWTSVGQTDCVVSEAEAATCSDQKRMAVNDENDIAMSGCAATQCAPDSDTITFMKNPEVEAYSRSLSSWSSTNSATYVRSERQPFVFSGDMFLYSEERNMQERSGVIRTTRLYDNKRGDFSMQQEELSLTTTAVELEYAECATEECYAERLRQNKIVLPLQVTAQPVYVSAVSEWAVHWVSTPDLANCAILFEVCAGRSAGGLSVEDEKARLWSVYTVRSTNELGEAFTESKMTSYMVIPQFFKCSQANQCNSVVNMKVTGLEYMNEENLLLTVLATSAENWDWRTNDVIEGGQFEYRYYFVHPNRHDCTTEGSTEATFTCWREESAGMFRSSELSLSAIGSLCPALQRMPKWGSMVAEVAVAVASMLEVFIETVFTLPASLTVTNGLTEVFQVRERPTFHRFLDMRGASLLDLDPCYRAIEQASFHLSNTITRAAKIFEGKPGNDVIEPVLLGTARVFQYTTGMTMVENKVLGPLASSIPFDKFVNKMSQNTQSAPPTPFAAAGAAKSNPLEMFSSMFSGATSWTKVVTKVARKVILKTFLKKTKRFFMRDVGNIIMVSAYESQGDMRRGAFDPMRYVCDGFGQVMGRTSAMGQFVRHSCMLGPDSMESFMTVLFIITLEYPVMDCVCKQVGGLETEEAIEKICMPQGMSMKQKSFVMQSARDAAEQQTSQCFRVMDAINDRLLKAMDPVLSRMNKAVMALQNTFASILSGAGSSSCTDWDASPFVISLLPEPVDYFMGCMHTIDCRSRCLDNMLAFEEALAEYRQTDAKDLALSKSFEIDTESRFFSANEEFEGKHLAPFAIYAVMPLEEAVCTAVCTGAARCVAIAGMEATTEDVGQGHLQTGYYCVPVSVMESVYTADTRINTTQYGSFGDDVVTGMHVASRHKAIARQGEWLVVVTRSAQTGLSRVSMLPGASDVSFELLQTRAFDVDTYSDTQDVNDRRWAAQRVNHIFVLPAHSNRSWCSVFFSVSQTTPEGFVDNVCVFTRLDTAEEGALYDNLLYPCSQHHDDIFPPLHQLICLDNDCKRAVRLPHAQADLELVEFAGYEAVEAEGPATFDWSYQVVQTAKISSQQRSAVRAYNEEMLTLMKNNKLQMTRRQLCSVGFVTRNTSNEVFVDVCMTGRGEAMETWLQNVRISLPKDAAVDVAVSTSFVKKQNVELVVNCSVSSCVGCQGSGPREADIQHKCFAAASCAVGRCVGSTVNMNRPMCQIGAMIAALADEYRMLLAAFWTFFANNIIFVVELSANRREKYEIAWPAEIKQMYTCKMKDMIIQFWSLFGAMIVNVITQATRHKSKGAMAQSYTDTTMQLSSEARSQAMTTISTTAFVELMVQINMAVVYAPIVVWKVMQCKLDSAFGVLSTGSDTTFKLGSAEFDKADEAAVGVCLGEKVKQALADVSDTNTNKGLKSDISSLISNLSSMITGQMLGNFAFMYDAFFAWAGGVCTGMMNLVQVMDWARCKLPSIDNAVVSSCVCGDRPARIPNAQRQSKQTTDSLWCYGPLMLSDTDGNDQLVWNPYSLHELLQLRTGSQDLQKYLDCISMNRCNFESLIPASVGSIEDYVSCINSNALDEPSCEQFAAYTECVNEKVDCNTLKPTDAVFEAQGVELMQVITRCRNNYQQKRWDQAAPLLGMLPVETWLSDPVTEAKKLAFDTESGSLSKERKIMSMLAQFMRPFTSLDEGTWLCLNSSLTNLQLSNNCAELGLANNIFVDASSLLTYFEYEIKEVSAAYENMDACESFSGRVSDRNEDNVVYPKLVWDGDSLNSVPVAELHYTKMYDKDWRMTIAERELDALIKHDITPVFKVLTTKALEEISTTYWSFDGDFVHQLVDCVMIGPFAAADMMPSFRAANGRQFNVPQYHRGDAGSRAIKFANKTSGSEIRQQIMLKIVEHIKSIKDDLIMKHVTASVLELQEAYTNKMNLYCRCFDGSKSLQCCLVSHEDISTFTRTFSAQYVLRKIEDLKEEIEGSFASSIFNSTLLKQDIWANESFTYTHSFDETDRGLLAEEYFFDYNKPVYHYTEEEVALQIQGTVWTQCMQAMRAAFYTLPLVSRQDDVLQVDADTVFDPTEIVPGAEERYMHATERVIERILEKAKLRSPVFWTHVHRYMPSDSVWCENRSEPVHADPGRARVPEQWHDMVFAQESIEAPDSDQVLYVGHVATTCPCAWKSDGACFLPLEVCNGVQPSFENANRWNALCSSQTFDSTSDIMFVRLVLENAAMDMPSCREYRASTVWGLLDSTQQYKWYNGQHEQWNVSLQEVATLGPGGIRLSDLLADSERDFDREILLRIQRDQDQGIWNSQFEHTIAQPVCNSSRKAYLSDSLSEYFTDVLFPMAHSIHEAPSQAICGRWVTEYALYALLYNVSGAEDAEVELQRLTEERWRKRCLVQLEQIGICNLRNVYKIAPSTHQSDDHCPFSVAQRETCSIFYVTDDCLVHCDGVFYDPCMCTDQPDCNFTFFRQSCANGVVLTPPSSSFDLSSLHWPRVAWPDKSTQELLDHVLANESVHGIPFVLDDEMIAYVQMHANKAEGGTPDAFCDDTLDYFEPEAQHPAGYHPTCACTRAKTNMRGFTSWMSSGDEYAWSIEPKRLRNMTRFSSAFGSSHLVCDATVYGVGYEMNNLQMQSKWNPNARADAAVPVKADFVSEPSMSEVGTVSGDAWDTPLVAADASKQLFAHSIGIVRDWLRYHGQEEGSREIQEALDDIWPHWPDTIDTYGANPSRPVEPGCSFPELFRCVRDSDCGDELECKFYDVDDSPLGICAQKDTCFRHDHCTQDKLCSGSGICVQPELVVRNSLDVDVDAQVFGKKAKQCSASPFGMSKEQRVPSFARDNGLCGVRDYFTYKNVTAEVRQTTEDAVFRVSNKRMLRTAQREEVLITDESNGFLRMEASACDRNYEHTDHDICSACPVNEACTASSACLCTESGYEAVAGMNTWQKNDAGGVDVRFCDIVSSDGDLANLVSPYVHTDGNDMPVDTLQQSRTDIKRCLDFDICPTSSFTIRGQSVSQRIVLVQDSVRAYALQDARLCFAFGVWNADTELCTLDLLVVPLFEVLYKDSCMSTSLDACLKELRDNCDNAFGSDYDTAMNDFETAYNELRMPYASSLSADIQAIVNTLLLKVFNLQPGSMRNRGIENMQQYKHKAKCVRYVYTSLEAVHTSNKAKLSAHAVSEDSTPGGTVYLFHPYAPLELPLLWFWKCVAVARDTREEGGAPMQWLNLMTQDLENEVACPNAESVSTQNSTLLRHLQLQPDIYISSVAARTNIDIFSDMLVALEMAFSFWNVDPLPSIHCYVTPTDEHDEWCNTSQYTKSCTRVFAPPTSDVPDKEDALNSMYDLALQFLFKKSRTELEEMNALTLQNLLDMGLAEERKLSSDLAEATDYSNAIPVFELTALSTDLNDLVTSQDGSIFRLQSTRVVNCLSSEPLEFAEYQIASSVCPSKRATQTFQPNDKLRVQMYKRIYSIIHTRSTDAETLDCFDTNHPEDKYAAISQKHALILMMYYLKYVIHSTRDSKFGMLTYDQDVRLYMQRDLALTRNVPEISAKASRYQMHIVAKNFICSENEQFPDPVPISPLQSSLRTCAAQLKSNIGWKVGKRQTLVLLPQSDLFLGGFYTSFAASASEKYFVDALVETDWQKAMYVNVRNELCFRTSTGAAYLRPLWTGGLDLQSCPFGESCGCETSQDDALSFFDVTCDGSISMQSCAKDFLTYYTAVTTGMYENCYTQQNKPVALKQFEQMKAGNLCDRKPPEQADLCPRAFGAQGRVRGRATTNLHSRDIVDAVQVGLFDVGSTILQGTPSTSENVTSVRLLGTDIGGHSIGFTVYTLGQRNSPSAQIVLDVTCVSAGRSCKDPQMRKWLPQAREVWRTQHLRFLARSVSVPKQTTRWTCPLQWLSMYSDNRTMYAARTPFANRNRARFEHVTGDSYYAHVTVSSALKVAQHPARFMSDASACADAVPDGSGFRYTCKGRTALLAATQLHKKTWNIVALQSAPSSCKRILDWPHRAFRTADGIDGGDVESMHEYCNVFDRLPSFAVRYLQVDFAALQKKDRVISTAPGGVCHMGLLKRLPKPNTTDSVQFCTAFPTHSRCRMLSVQKASTESQTLLVSAYDAEIQPAAPHIARKDASRPLRHCKMCEDHASASFVDEFQRHRVLEHGPAQLSVGLPIRLSSERVLAAEIRRRLCPDSKHVCDKMRQLIRRKPEVWRKHMLMPELLATAKQHHHATAPSVRDDELWAKPWVFCKNQPDRCYGLIDKRTWQDPDTRFDACRSIVADHSQQNSTPTRFCTLSPQLSNLCVKLARWSVEDIPFILCKAAGHPDCLSQGFFYNPTAFSISNKDFVYNSVRAMYTKLDAAACPATPANRQVLQNEVLRSQCGSVALEPIRNMLQIARSFGFDFSILQYCIVSMGMNMFGIILGAFASMKSLVSESAYNMKLYAMLFLNKLGAVMGVLWKVLFQLADYDAFKWIKTIVKMYCWVLENVIAPVVKKALLPLFSVLLSVFKELEKGLNVLNLGWVFKPAIGILTFAVDATTNFPERCEEEDNEDDETRSPGTLPVATKCWSTYNTFFGDNNVLSCTKADTCHRGVTDTSLVMCGACPSPSTDFAPFGCLSVTKTCTCSVPVFTTQYCESNSDCYTEESSCKYLDGELEPSIGFTRCSSCQHKRICFVGAGASVGYCACTLFDVQWGRCLDQGAAVNPGYDKMCVLTTDYNALQSSFVFGFDESMSSPCRLLNQGFTFCSRESGNGFLYVTGTEVSSRRRLLGIDAPEDSGFTIDTMSSVCRDALSTDLMPNVRRECLEAFEESKLTVRMLGMQDNWPACAFCGVEDMLHNFMLKPHNLIILFSNASAVAHVVMRHTYVKDLMLVCKTWRTMAHVLAHDMQDIVISNDTNLIIVQLMNFTIPDVDSNNDSVMESSHTSQRRLLTVKDNIADAITRASVMHKSFIQQASVYLSFTFETPEQQSEWMSTWPPKINSQGLTQETCTPAVNVIKALGWTFGNLTASYAAEVKQDISSSISAVWVLVPSVDTGIPWDAVTDKYDTVTRAALWLVDYLLGLVGLERSDIYDLISAMINEFPHVVRCDVKAVQTCYKWKKHALHVLAVLIVYFAAVYVLALVLGLGGPVLLLMTLLPYTVMYMTYGFSPFCSPMVPVCIYDDFLWTARFLLPVHVELPLVMYKNASCVPLRSAPVRSECLRTCSDEPFAYGPWQTVLAWWSVEFRINDFALDAVNLMPRFLVTQNDYDALVMQVALKRRVFVDDDKDLLLVNRLCAFVGLYVALPYMFILLLCIMLLSTMLQTVVVLLTAVSSIIVGVVVSSFI